MKAKEGYELLYTQLASVDTPSLEAYLLLETCGITRMDVHQNEKTLSCVQIQRLLELAEKRTQGYPLQYLLGEWTFYRYTFAVGEGVLIPRQDTETLCEVVLQHLKGKRDSKVVDLCSGSGCIAVTLDRELAKQGIEVYAVEKSDEAYPYLKKNIEKNHSRVHPMQADVLELDCIFEDGLFDAVVSNPPYLNEQDMQNLQKEVRYEPSMALLAPENGLYFYRRIAELFQSKLKAGGLLAFEIGIHQEDAVMAFLKANGFVRIGVQKDLCGINRVVFGQKP